MGNANVEILILEQDIRVLDMGSSPYTFLTKSELKMAGYRSSAGNFITKEIKEPENRVLLRAILFSSIVSYVVSNLCHGTYRRNRILAKFFFWTIFTD